MYIGSFLRTEMSHCYCKNNKHLQQNQYQLIPPKKLIPDKLNHLVHQFRVPQPVSIFFFSLQPELGGWRKNTSNKVPPDYLNKSRRSSEFTFKRAYSLFHRLSFFLHNFSGKKNGNVVRERSWLQQRSWIAWNWKLNI